MRTVLLGLLGLVLAVAVGFGVHLITRDTISLPVVQLEQPPPSPARATTTTTRQTTTTTTDEVGTDSSGRGRGRGRSGGDSGGNSGPGGGDD